MWLTTRSVLTGALLVSASVLEAQQAPPSQFPQQAPPQQQQAPPGQQQQAPAGQLPPQAPPQQPAQDVVAVVNGDAVTHTEVEVRMKSQIQGQQIDPQTAEKLRQQTLNSLIESRLVEQHVTKEGPSVKPEEVDMVVTRVKQQLAAQQADYNQYLASLGHDEASFKKRITGSLAWRKFQQQEMNEEKLQKFFQQNQDQFPSKNFEEVQPQVAQAYVVSLWEDIISERKPKAEIQILKPQAPTPPPANPPGGFPGSVPQ